MREKEEEGVYCREQNEQMEFTRTMMPPKPPAVLLQKVVETMLMSANVPALVTVGRVVQRRNS